jgi:hypothetical protein
MLCFSIVGLWRLYACQSESRALWADHDKDVVSRRLLLGGRGGCVRGCMEKIFYYQYLAVLFFGVVFFLLIALFVSKKESICCDHLVWLLLESIVLGSFVCI